MQLDPLYRCQDCFGRISSSGKYTRNYMDELSASLNELACTFVFKANTNLMCTFPVFREARRLREALETAVHASLTL